MFRTMLWLSIASISLSAACGDDDDGAAAGGQSTAGSGAHDAAPAAERDAGGDRPAPSGGAGSAGNGAADAAADGELMVEIDGVAPVILEASATIEPHASIVNLSIAGRFETGAISLLTQSLDGKFVPGEQSCTIGLTLRDEGAFNAPTGDCQLALTKVSTVGERITGSFSGTVRKVVGTGEKTIAHGRFDLLLEAAE